MEWLDALILGIVQGLSEYLPISSSGHLEIFREILGINLPSDKKLSTMSLKKTPTMAIGMHERSIFHT